MARGGKGTEGEGKDIVKGRKEGMEMNLGKVCIIWPLYVGGIDVSDHISRVSLFFVAGCHTS